MSATGSGCGPQLAVTALPGVPIVGSGDDLVRLAIAALDRAAMRLQDGDVLVFASKLLSRAEGRFVDLATVEVSPRAEELAEAVMMEPALVELILRESIEVSRSAPGVLVVRHRLGFVSANAGIDRSNAEPSATATDRSESGADASAASSWILLLPQDPDASASAMCAALSAHYGANIGVIISDSLGRPFRQGTVGSAIGVAGVPAMVDFCGTGDLFGRAMQATVTALADQIAAAADLVAGQGREGRGIVHVRGVFWQPGDGDGTSAKDLQRSPEQDLYA